MFAVALAGWLLAAALGLGWFVSKVRLDGALARAIHEVRRPLHRAFLLAPADDRSLAAAMNHTLSALDELEVIFDRGGNLLDSRLVDLRQIVEECLDIREDLRHSPHLHIRWNTASSQVLGDPARLHRVFDNLIENAASHGRPPLWISAASETGWLRVSLGNAAGAVSGKRPSTSQRPKAGHGLRIVRDLVGQHGGRFRCREIQGRWEAVVELPLPRG